MRCSRRFGEVETAFFDTSGKIDTYMEANWNRLVVMNALKVLGGLEYCWVALRSMRSVAYQFSRGWRRGSWCRSVGFGQYQKGEDRWEDAQAHT